MNIFLKRKIILALCAILLAGGGLFYFFSFTGGGTVLRDGLAMAVQSWQDIWCGNEAVADSGQNATQQTTVATSSRAQAASKKPKTSSATKAAQSCWPSEPADLDRLARLLEQSNAGIAALAARLSPSSSVCASPPVLAPAFSSSPSLAVSSLTVQFASSVSEIAPAAFPCAFPDSANPSRKIIFNEIAWMGSPPAPGESGTKAGNREWIELKNISGAPINLLGWQVSDASGKLKIFFDGSDSISAGLTYLLSRDGGAVNAILPDRAYTGALANSGGALAIFDADCGISDFLNASGGWPAGDNDAKRTMERKSDAIGWQTSALPGGTPRAENSPGLASYLVQVAIQGDGAGKVASIPAGISCLDVAANISNCSAEYAAGTAITLSAAAAQGVVFDGWTGGCSGMGKCTFTVGGPMSITATFRSNLSEAASELAGADDASPDAGSSSGADSSSSPAASASSSANIPGALGSHLLIAQVQIAGAAASNDFVKIYNPTAAAVSLNGWKLRKKSSSGTDYSLRAFGAGDSVPSGGYFIWANSASGFAQAIGAQASSSETLAADNSVALIDPGGAVADAVAWGKGTNQYVETAPYGANPIANQVLGRKSDAAGGLVDTDNNAEDFELH